jgi:hypothetical protein
MNMSRQSRFIVMLLLLAVGIWLDCSDDDDNGVDPGNHSPVISAIEANPDTFAAGTSVIVTVQAEDPDGDPLEYGWSTPSSWLVAVFSSGNMVELTNCCAVTAIDSTYLRAIVSDNRGGETRDSIQIWVLPGRK